MRVFNELQGVTNYDDVLEITLGTIAYVLEKLRSNRTFSRKFNVSHLLSIDLTSLLY